MSSKHELSGGSWLETSWKSVRLEHKLNAIKHYKDSQTTAMICC